jgi:hypothetical protein
MLFWRLWRVPGRRKVSNDRKLPVAKKAGERVRGKPMSLAEEYREFAQECVRWATDAHTDEHRQMLLELAKTWTLAALKAEEGVAPQRRVQSRNNGRLLMRMKQ